MNLACRVRTPSASHVRVRAYAYVRTRASQRTRTFDRHRHHYELIAMGGCMGKPMVPRVSYLHGKTHGMGKPMDVVMGKPMGPKSTIFNDGGRRR